MKKKLIVGLAALFLTASLAFFTACDFDTNNGTNSSNDSDSSSTTQPVPAFTPPAEPITLTVRTEVATITDSGRASQKMDKVLLSNYFNVKTAYQAGYTKLNVTLRFEAREIDDGYQYVFLYADSTCKGNSILDKIVDEIYDPEDPSLLYEYRFEHGGSEKNTQWGEHTFSTTIKTSRLKDDLYIRYGASGKYNDDWMNRNIEITFTLEK